ncbi:MAG: hypothetical protein WDM87_04450 [Terracidiphilus sp.]
MNEGRIKFRLRWALLSTAAMLICYFVGFKEVSKAFFIVTVILLTVYEITSRFVVLPIKQVEEETDDEEPEEFGIHFPDPAEYGWHNYTVIPSRNIYKEQLCFGGPPTDNSTFEYSVKGESVFSRLVDLVEDGFKDKQYEVVNGQVLEDEIRSRKQFDSTDQYIERLKKEVKWSELTGSLRYFILSKHGSSSKFTLSFFVQEKERLTKAIAALDQRASEVGGVRIVEGALRGCYKAKDEASEQSKAAIKELQSAESLQRFGLSFVELRDYEHTVQMLDDLLAGNGATANM